jgi:alanyl-tRNA synthetase
LNKLQKKGARITEIEEKAKPVAKLPIKPTAKSAKTQQTQKERALREKQELEAQRKAEEEVKREAVIKQRKEKRERQIREKQEQEARRRAEQEAQLEHQKKLAQIPLLINSLGRDHDRITLATLSEKAHLAEGELGEQLVQILKKHKIPAIFYADLKEIIFIKEISAINLVEEAAREVIKGKSRLAQNRQQGPEAFGTAWNHLLKAKELFEALKKPEFINVCIEKINAIQELLQELEK